MLGINTNNYTYYLALNLYKFAINMHKILLVVKMKKIQVNEFLNTLV